MPSGSTRGQPCPSHSDPGAGPPQRRRRGSPGEGARPRRDLTASGADAVAVSPADEVDAPAVAALEAEDDGVVLLVGDEVAEIDAFRDGAEGGGGSESGLPPGVN